MPYLSEEWLERNRLLAERFMSQRADIYRVNQVPDGSGGYETTGTSAPFESDVPCQIELSGDPTETLTNGRMERVLPIAIRFPYRVNVGSDDEVVIDGKHYKLAGVQPFTPDSILKRAVGSLVGETSVGGGE